MITLGINLLIVSVLLLIVGLIKPNWILFFMDKPSRMGIITLASLVFMVGATVFGEGMRQKKALQAQTHPSQPQPQPPAGETSKS